MHVNGAPPMMQPPMQGGVPAPGQMPSSGPGPLAPGGEFFSGGVGVSFPTSVIDLAVIIFDSGSLGSRDEEI